MHDVDNVQAGDLETEIGHYVNLWVELEVAVGCLRLKSWLFHLLIQHWRTMSTMKGGTQKMLDE